MRRTVSALVLAAAGLLLPGCVTVDTAESPATSATEPRDEVELDPATAQRGDPVTVTTETCGADGGTVSSEAFESSVALDDAGTAEATVGPNVSSGLYDVTVACTGGDEVTGELQVLAS